MIHFPAEVGVGVFVRKPSGLVLTGERIGSHGGGTHSIPGGSTEPGESVVRASERELFEETGISATCQMLVLPARLRSFEKKDGIHTWVTLYALADVPEDTVAELREPTKCRAWRWVKSPFSVDGSLFGCLADVLDALDLSSEESFAWWFRNSIDRAVRR